MLITTDELAKRLAAQDILAANLSDDLKLFEIFEIYKENLQKEHDQLYYALLGWKDSHLKDLLEEESSSEFFKQFKGEKGDG